MANKKRSGRLIEWGKNLLIVLLTLSAVYLLGLTQIPSALSPASGGTWSAVWSLFSPKQSAGVSPIAAGGALSAVRPVRLAVCREGQRCGLQYDTAAVDAAFAELTTLLSEALGSAGEPQQITEREWRGALGRDGLYFDFLAPLPLSALSAWLGSGTDNPALTHAARRVCLAADGDNGVSLFYHNESDGLYYACGTTLSQKIHLDTVVADWSPNGAVFAFETEGMEALEPYTMLFAPAQIPVFSSVNPLTADTNRLNELLSALAFHPQSAGLDPVSGGQAVEGTDTLRLTPGGMVTFHSIRDAEFRFAVPGESRQEVLDYVRALAEATAGAWCGDARLYLDKIEEKDGALTVTFQYCLEGAPVTLPGGNCAARFVVRAGAVTDFTLYLRSYTAAGETAFVLPELQAAAAMEALGAGGRELTLCYQDSGGSQVSASWVAR